MLLDLESSPSIDKQNVECYNNCTLRVYYYIKPNQRAQSFSRAYVV